MFMMPILYPQHGALVKIDKHESYTHNVAMSEKELFKLWVEKGQLTKFKRLAHREKLSMAWLMRKAFDEFLAKPKAGKKK
jgi:hypothetical protein